ncbi:MAG: SUMF1/EgtB/PvdO family nonheme iron enzyme [bacterium]
MLDNGIHSVYAFLASSALWPVVQAFRDGDRATILAIGGVFSSLGINLLSSRIDAWKNQAEAAQEIEKVAAQEPDLRAELDTILEKLEVFQLAQQELATIDRAGFVKTVQRELKRLGNLPRFQAVVHSGVLVQAGHAEIKDNITISGDNPSVTFITQQYLKRGDAANDAVALRRHIANYLTWLRDRCGKIELRGIKREGEQVVQLDLQSVYVPLAAEAYRPWGDNELGNNSRGVRNSTRILEKDRLEREQSRTIAMRRLLQQGNRLVVTGGPGSGKTTVLMHIAWTLATALGHAKSNSAREKLGLTDALPLPILVPLNAYAGHLRHLPAAASPAQKTLASFISSYLIEKQSSFDLPREFFQLLLRDGQAVILLLDGLDEVPNEDERARVREAIEELATGRERMRIVVTCRTAAYKDRTALGRGFREVRVKPLEKKHINALVKQAYRNLYCHDPKTCREKINDLLHGIAKLEQDRRVLLGEDAERLVTSPLLVRMLLVVHYSERTLPNQRAELYMKATDNILKPEYSQDVETANRIGRLVGGSLERHREVVQYLAFAMHCRGTRQGREISEYELRQALADNPVFAPLLDDFIALTRLRGTLLEERLGNYRFIHLAFQEYLAARYLAEIKRGESGVEGIAAFLENGPILDSWWREPALLVAGYLSVNSPQTAQMFLRRLAGADEKAGSRSPLSPEARWTVAEIAASAFLEAQVPPENLQTVLAVRLTELFYDSETMAQVRPTLRAATGQALARLGDPRDAVLRVERMEFCLIPKGPFYMGSPLDEEAADDDEKTDNLTRHMDRDFWISRFPITNAQFQTFVKAGGYEEPKFWTEAKAAKVWKNGAINSRWDNEPRIRPADFGSPFNLSNHPAVGITWYEALAFARWLEKLYHERGWLDERWQVTLPSEAEWEKAARGGIHIPSEKIVRAIHDLDQGHVELRENPLPQRRYPWIGEEDSSRANYDHSGIGKTSPVGCFSNGQSPYGCEEMSGNVWEWTRSLWGKYPYPDDQEGRKQREHLGASEDKSRVLRGGAFGNGGGGVRCAYRFRGGPDRQGGNFGFRVAALPSLLER